MRFKEFSHVPGQCPPYPFSIQQLVRRHIEPHFNVLHDIAENFVAMLLNQFSFQGRQKNAS